MTKVEKDGGVSMDEKHFSFLVTTIQKLIHQLEIFNSKIPTHNLFQSAELIEFFELPPN